MKEALIEMIVAIPFLVVGVGALMLAALWIAFPILVLSRLKRMIQLLETLRVVTTAPDRSIPVRYPPEESQTPFTTAN